MTLLRDGSTVQDPRLGRIPSFDERSRAFPLRALIVREALPDLGPRSYSWIPGGSFGRAVHLDQGQLGGCVAWTLGHDLRANPVIDTRADNTWCRDTYFAIQRTDEYPGGEYPGASPVEGGTSMTAGAEYMRGLGHFTEYRWANVDNPGRAVDEIKLVVSRLGGVPWGINWTNDMFDPDANGFIRPTGPIAGGHSIYICGNSMRLKAFRLWQSWGTPWGWHGEGWCWISWQDAIRLQGDSGEAYFPTRQAIR